MATNECMLFVKVCRPEQASFTKIFNLGELFIRAFFVICGELRQGRTLFFTYKSDWSLLMYFYLQRITCFWLVCLYVRSFVCHFYYVAEKKVFLSWELWDCFCVWSLFEVLTSKTLRMHILRESVYFPRSKATVCRSVFIPSPTISNQGGQNNRCESRSSQCYQGSSSCLIGLEVLLGIRHV